MNSAILLIDGRSGSGKTTCAAQIAQWIGGAPILHMDSLYPGWTGLADGSHTLERVLTDLTTRGEATCPTWDWERSAPGEPLILNGQSPLIVEGCGALTSRTAQLADCAIWIDADDEVRRKRALMRDGDMFRPYWQTWAEQEERHIAAHNPRHLADLVLSGEKPITREDVTALVDRLS